MGKEPVLTISQETTAYPSTLWNKISNTKHKKFIAVLKVAINTAETEDYSDHRDKFNRIYQRSYLRAKENIGGPNSITIAISSKRNIAELKRLISLGELTTAIIYPE